MGKDKIYYITNKKNDLNYCQILPFYNSKFVIPYNLIIYSDILKCHKSDAISVRLPKKYLKQISSNEFVVLKQMFIKSKNVYLIHKYDNHLKKHREYTLEDYFEKEISRIKENINNNMSVKERDFYHKIFTGSINEIVVYRTMGKNEYEKLINNKTIHGKLQTIKSSNSYGKKVVCFFDENMKNMNEYYPSLDAYRIVAFKVKVSLLTLSFGRYDYEEGVERWRYEWTIDKYNLKIFKLIEDKEFNISRMKKLMMSTFFTSTFK